MSVREVEKWRPFKSGLRRLFVIIENSTISPVTVTLSEIKRDIGGRSRFVIPTYLHSLPPLRGTPSEFRYSVSCRKKRLKGEVTRW